MARLLQLFKDEKEILGSDGIMYVDGRYNMGNVIEAVKERNNRMKNIPHKIADSFALYINGDIKRGYKQIIKL